MTPRTRTTDPDTSRAAAKTDGDRWGVVANVAIPHRALRLGARVWVCNRNPGWGGENVRVRGLSIGGRIIDIWCHRRTLTRFRRAWVPKHLRSLVDDWHDRENCDKWAKVMSQAESPRAGMNINPTGESDG